MHSIMRALQLHLHTFRMEHAQLYCIVALELFVCPCDPRGEEGLDEDANAITALMHKIMIAIAS